MDTALFATIATAATRVCKSKNFNFNFKNFNKRLKKELLPGDKPSRGGQSLHAGARQEGASAARLGNLKFNGIQIRVGKTAGGNDGVDIPAVFGEKLVGFESGTNGKFEGTGCTLSLEGGRLEVPEKQKFLKELMGAYRPWGGVVPSLDKKCPDDHYPLPNDAVARAYRAKGADYIQIGKGLYHTGGDVLGLGVPLFECEGTTLRTRVTKHMKKLPDGSRKPTDYTTAIVFPTRRLVRSPYSLFGVLPPGFTEV